jgi:hypothetical protein
LRWRKGPGGRGRKESQMHEADFSMRQLSLTD